MARVIDIEFNDRKFTIEYNRKSVVRFMTMQENDNDLNTAIKLIQCGLLKHHENELPDEDEIFAWVLAMGDDAQAFVSALKECVEEVLNTIKNDKEQSGFKWGARK